MRTHIRWLYLAPLLSAVPIALVHCSSTPASPSKGNDGGLNSASGSGSGGVSGSGSGGSSSGGTSGSSGGNNGGGNPVVDGGASSSGGPGDGSAAPPACVSVDGGAQCSAPLMLPCGSSTCNTSSDYCCIDTASDGGGAQTCVAPNGSCSPTATKISCKEAADCANGAVCCGNFPMLGVQGNTSCLASCSGNQNVQICRTDSECGGSADGGGLQKCVLQTCGPLTLQLCAVSPGGGFGGPQPDAGGAYAGCTAK